MVMNIQIMYCVGVLKNTCTSLLLFTTLLFDNLWNLSRTIVKNHKKIEISLLTSASDLSDILLLFIGIYFTAFKSRNY